MKKNNKENTVGYKFDSDLTNEETITTTQNISIQLITTGSENEESYTAIFENGDDLYCLNGNLSYNEIKEILRGIIILEE